MNINRRTILIIFLVILVLALATAAYFLFFRRAGQPTSPSPTPISVITPSVSAPNITFASQSPYLGATLSFDGQKIRYYDTSANAFMESDGSGLNPVRLLNNDLKNVVGVNWAPNKSKAIVTTDDRGIKKYQMIDFSSGQAIPYGSQFRSIVFSPASDKIAYNFLDPATGANKIEISDPSGQNWQNVSALRIQDLKIDWPQSDRLSVYSLSSAFAASPLLLLNLTDKSLTKLNSEAVGLSVLWSPDGTKAIYSLIDQASGYPVVKLISAANGSAKDLPVSTFAEKCAWSGNNAVVYCAVPFGWPVSRANLPDDYYRQTFFTNDQIIKIDPDTAKTQTVFDAKSNPPEISNLFTDSDGRRVFFTNQKDGLFYAAKIQ